jgi:hypothetical protein
MEAVQGDREAFIAQRYGPEGTDFGSVRQIANLLTSSDCEGAQGDPSPIGNLLNTLVGPPGT